MRDIGPRRRARALGGARPASAGRWGAPLLFISCLSAGASVWLACGSSTFSGADAGAQKVPADCNLTADPKDSPACVDDSIGIFVSPSGDDSHAGTKDAPLLTLGKALTKADSQHDRIYLCSGTYVETVRLTGPVSIYGGYSCNDWSYAGTAGGTAPKIAPSAPGYALDVESVGAAVTIEDVELDAKSGQNPGDSSIAVLVANSSGPVTFRRAVIVAGDGASGIAAVATSNYTGPVATKGAQADHNTGAPPTICSPACVDTTVSTGGAGGGTNQNGADGGPAIPANPSGHDGFGGIAPGDDSCSTAAPHTGADGAEGSGSSVGAPNAGMLNGAGWKVSAGVNGATGAIAQGGGGGQGLNTSGGMFNGGGSGGCGGCGGAGGAGGGSGGSAFAILVFQSSVIADSCSLSVGNAGDGQPGGDGQVGQLGGAGGSPAFGGVGCFGAPGGKGGDGAGGGGGAGGDAIAIAYVGTQPSLIGGTQSEGHAGAIGNGGNGAGNNDGTAGAAGTKSDIAALP